MTTTRNAPVDPFLGTSTHDIILQMELDAFAWELEKWTWRMARTAEGGYKALYGYWEHEEYVALVRRCFTCPNREYALRTSCKVELQKMAESLEIQGLFDTITNVLFNGLDVEE